MLDTKLYQIIICVNFFTDSIASVLSNCEPNNKLRSGQNGSFFYTRSFYTEPCAQWVTYRPYTLLQFRAPGGLDIDHLRR